MALQYFYDGMSQPARSILLLLKCTNVEFEPCIIQLGKGTRQNLLNYLLDIIHSSL